MTIKTLHRCVLMQVCFTCVILCRPARFNSVHHLSILFPTNFGAETTKVYYIGLRGDYMEVCNTLYTIW